MSLKKKILSYICAGGIALGSLGFIGCDRTHTSNDPPKIISAPLEEIIEGESGSFQVDATDEDGDALKYSMVGPSWFSINPQTGLVTWKEQRVDKDTHYDVVINVSDGKDSDTQDWNPTIKDTVRYIPVSSGESIQDAIDLIDENDGFRHVIEVAAGMYGELITINKPLTLRGATYKINKNGYKVPANYAWNTNIESIIQPPEEANDYSAVVDIVDINDVTFEGFIVQELNAIGNVDDSLLRVYANTKEISNIIVRNNIIGPFTNTIFQDGTHGRMGLYIVNHPYSDEYGVVNSIFSGNKIFDCKGNGNNVFIWSSYSNPSYGAPGPASMRGTIIEDNEIYGAHRSGIETAGGYSGLTIKNNKIYDNRGSTISGKPEIMFGNGIVLIRGSGDSHLEDNPGLGPENLTIIDNEIYNNQRNAIYMGPINKNYTITRNKIYGNDWDGIRLDFTALYHNPDFEEWDRIPWADQTENILANKNKIYNNGQYGIRVVGVPTNGFILDAINNWWGTNNEGEIAGMVSGSVDYNPWANSEF